MITEYPIRFKNATGSTIPAFGIFRLEGGEILKNALVPHAEKPTGGSDDALFVNSAQEIEDGKFGWCKPVTSGPFWVKPHGDYSPTNGDVVGTEEDEFFVSDDGSGLVVVYYDSEKELVLCDLLSGGGGGGDNNQIQDAELTANLSPASNSKSGASTASAKFLVPDPDNAGDLMDGDAFTVTNRSLDASGLSGDYCVVARIGGEWRLVWIDC